MKTLPSIFWCCATVLVLAANPLLSSNSVSTNAGGWHVVIGADSTIYSSNRPIHLFLSVSNSTANKTGYMGIDPRPKTFPGFGKLIVKNLREDREISFSGKEQSWGSWQSEGGGNLPPGAFVSADYNMTINYHLKPSEKYSIVLVGSINSLNDPKTAIQFSTPPLVITIAPANIKNNPVR